MEIRGKTEKYFLVAGPLPDLIHYFQEKQVCTRNTGQGSHGKMVASLHSHSIYLMPEITEYFCAFTMSTFTL
jgi:hypothetical protein